MQIETLNPSQCTVDLCVFTHSHSTNRVSFLTCFPDIHVLHIFFAILCCLFKSVRQSCCKCSFLCLRHLFVLRLYVHHDLNDVTVCMYMFGPSFFFLITCICYLPKTKIFGASESVKYITNLLRFF